MAPPAGAFDGVCDQILHNVSQAFGVAIDNQR